MHTAHELLGMLDGLRRSRGEEVLEVDLICHSNAARVARYLIKYGAASLEEAEAGTAAGPERIRVRKLILVGTANGGALGTFQDLNRSRTYFPLLGRKFRPEVAFTYPSLLEALPTYHEDLFFDREGRPLNVDLFDLESWKRFGWSIYAPGVQKRLRKDRRKDLFGDEELRAIYLSRALDHAHRLHELLEQDVEDFGDTRYYMVQNAYQPTPDRALLIERKGRWQTRFSTHGGIDRGDYQFTLASAPGDGHATLESQMWLSGQERRALARPPAYVDAPHRQLISDRATHRWILEYLLD